MNKQQFDTQVNRIKSALTNLRPEFSGTPDLEILSMVLQNEGACSPASLADFARASKTFSTSDVMQHFQVNKYKVAGSLAALARAGKIKRAKPDQDEHGYSRYVWVAKPKKS